MYGSNQINGLAGHLGEVRQDANGNLYQLGQYADERGNLGLGWLPLDQPQLGEIRRGADGQLYQYGVDGLGNFGFGPLAALASKALPFLSKIPGVSNIVQGLLPGMIPGASAPVPMPPVSATVSVPAPAPMPMPFSPMYPRTGLRNYLNSLVPRIADATAQMVVEKLQPTLTRRGRRGRRGVAGIGEDPYLYGIGEDYPYGIGERVDESLLGETDPDLGLGYDGLGEGDPYFGDSVGYSDYEPVNGIDGYQRQQPGAPLDGYVKGPISSGPAFTSRETQSELWKPLW